MFRTMFEELIDGGKDVREPQQLQYALCTFCSICVGWVRKSTCVREASPTSVGKLLDRGMWGLGFVPAPTWHFSWITSTTLANVI
jgi:hypothetical protein